jgi:Zn-dependent M28 family amino/carboxypeptidase
VLVTAHLDSTAASSGGPYDPAADPAPGSDDDASGIAAILAIAEMLGDARSTLRPRRTIRCVLFNAEEQGLIGSKAYARGQAAQQADLSAVFQMDMIGYRARQKVSPWEFEVHAGYPASAAVEMKSLELARIVREIAQAVSPRLNAPQIYPDPTSGAEDPAAGRSDHGPFNERGYAACVVSEDFFSGPQARSPEAAPNPHYHKSTDREIDYEYAAEITRVVAAAAFVAAMS